LREKLIKELEQRNAELEQFAYTVSHDLRNPVITIKGFVAMLEKDVRENKLDRFQTDIDRISNAADKMGGLLRDLLSLAQVGRVVNPPEEIDLALLTEEVLETLDERIRASKVTVEISPHLSAVYADRVRMCEVMENLVDNAAKYMGNQSHPLIEIGGESSGTETVIYVKDNGLGIGPQFHTKIFDLFDKLNSDTEGTGVGLALVKRIIEFHGGKIWVESEGSGKGSIFCFTIPSRRNMVERKEDIV
jgi:light-regulated signal transduction histidine kinase (bacteriophytochrome)